MLSVKTQQLYLKHLGFYDGEVDGISGSKTKEAILKLQKKYFTRSSDIDGIYGKNTDILLTNARRIQFRTKNFKLEEFKCGCGGKYCTGYPTYINRDLLENIQDLRDIYGAAINITSGLRCQKYNNSLAGSISTSRHIKGQAIDFYGTMTNTKTKRQQVIRKWYTKKNANYAYSDTPNMGTSVHVDVKG